MATKGIHHLLGMDEKTTVDCVGLAHLKVELKNKTRNEGVGREERGAGGKGR